MKTATAQFNLFDEAPGYREAPRPSPRMRKVPTVPGQEIWEAEAAAQRLEESGDYRVLRRLVPWQVIRRKDSAYPNLAVLVNTETTGFQHTKDEVIKIGAAVLTACFLARYGECGRAAYCGARPRTRRSGTVKSFGRKRKQSER